jgi:hypothetical protein
MLELPEFVTLARQINETITGKVISNGSVGNTPHKFVWYNRASTRVRRADAGQDRWKSPRKGEMALRDHGPRLRHGGG